MSESLEEVKMASKVKGMKYFKWNEALETILLETLLTEDIVNAPHGSKQSKLKMIRDTLETNEVFKTIMETQNVHLPKDASFMKHAEDIVDRIVKHKGLSLTSLPDMDLSETMEDYTELEYHAICYKQALLRKEQQSLVDPKKRKAAHLLQNVEKPQLDVTEHSVKASSSSSSSSGNVEVTSSPVVVDKVDDLVAQEPKPVQVAEDESMLHKKREDTMYNMVNYLMNENKELKEEVKLLKEENKKCKEQLKKRRLNEDAGEA